MHYFQMNLAPYRLLKEMACCKPFVFFSRHHLIVTKMRSVEIDLLINQMDGTYEY